MKEYFLGRRSAQHAVILFLLYTFSVTSTVFVVKKLNRGESTVNVHVIDGISKYQTNVFVNFHATTYT